ncbi:FG-GAP-like repeat-containing protein [Leptolyngbya sp. AN03gr2]|uniref:FG-GAP-like repeat-containing protein n=1 Tax=unclassified Leptolyngbya TaxID=2650499 RepID=UPI003D314A80
MSFNTFDTARSINLTATSQSFAGTVNLTDPVDFYRLQINSKSSIQLSLTGLSGNANLELIQDRNRNGVIDTNETLQRSTNATAIAELINTVLNPGTYFIRVAASNSSTNYRLDVSGLSAPTADIVWRHSQAGSNLTWTMESSTPVSARSLPTVADPNWQIVGSADFNRDSQVDYVWRNAQSGENLVWLMNGGNPIGMITLPQVADRNWQLVTVNDFNRDSQPDLLWRHIQSGENLAWSMNGATPFGVTVLPQVADRNWQIVGSGDFDRNNSPDIVWRHAASGENLIWFMNGNQAISSASLPTLADRNWQVAAVTDFNGDAQPDLLWRNALSGNNVIWFTQGATVTLGIEIASVADTNWRIVAANSRSDEPATIDSVGNSRSTAFNIGTLNGAASFSENFTSTDTEDFYQFTLNEVTELNVGLSNTAVNVQILDSNGNVLSPPTGSSRLLGAGTYFLRAFVSSPTATAYTLSLNPTSRPVVQYDFIYYYNGQNTSGDYYSGTVTAFNGTYAVGQFFDLTNTNNETGANGRYLITGSRTGGTIADLNRVTIQSYYDSETTTFFTPAALGQNANGLGSEVGWIRDRVDSQYFGADFFEADWRSIALVQIPTSVRQGTTPLITWRDTISENVRIDVFRNGARLGTLNESTESDGEFQWSVLRTLAVGSNYQVRVTSLADSNLFAESNPFDIIHPGTISITSPNGGNLFRPGSTQTITWMSNVQDGVTLQLFKGTTLHSTIASSTENDGVFQWILPTNLVDGTDYQIRISSVLNSLVWDLSDANFTIQALGDPGNTLTTAESSNVIFSRTQQVSSSDQNDFYRFSIGQPGVFTASLAGLSGDADVRLIQDFNNNGQIDTGDVLAWQWERGATNESIRRFISSGNYFIQVMSYNNQSANYTLSTNFTAQATDDRRFDIQLDYSDGSTSMLSSNMRAAIEEAVQFWERIITHSSLQGVHNLVIRVKTGALDWNNGVGTLAKAGPDGSGLVNVNGLFLPTTGETVINSVWQAFSTMQNNLPYFKRIMIHEIAHILGIGTLWDVGNLRLTNFGTSSYSANTYAGWAYGEMLGVGGQVAVPVSEGFHWSEAVFGNELMTPEISETQTTFPTSVLTIAGLRDLGWNVNFGAAEAFNALTRSLTTPSELTGMRIVCGCQGCLSNQLPMIGETSLLSQIIG